MSKPARKMDESDPEPDGIEQGKRLVRIDGDKGLSLAETIAAQFRLLAWRSPLHKLRLRGRFPLRLLAAPADPIAGNAEIGRALAVGQFEHLGEVLPVTVLRQQNFLASNETLDWIQGFAWLRDLAAAMPRPEAIRVAEPLVRAWLSAHGEFDPIGWRPDLIGQRILFWAAYAPLILSSTDLVYRSAVLNGLARMARHLERSAARADEGLPRIAAHGGLIAAGLLIPGGEARQVRGEYGLERALNAHVYPDGGVASRAPIDALELLELLLLVRSAYSSRRLLPPPWFDAVLDRLVPALRGVTLGDGGLSAWHGNGPTNAGRIERAITASGIATRPLRHAPEWGYQRLAGGKTVIICDTGPPPVARLSDDGHASTLAFELSDGPQRLIVNCGGRRGGRIGLPQELATLLRMTAAHSTLVIADKNSTAVRNDGVLGKGVTEVIVNRQENEAGTWIEATHDGYVRRFGLEHCRKLYLSARGDDLRGEDVLAPPRGRRLPSRGRDIPFDVRFHLAPGVEAVPTADGHGALLKLPGGAVWRFRCRGGTLGFDDSLWIDGDGIGCPSRQMVVGGTAPPGGHSVAWSFQKAG